MVKKALALSPKKTRFCPLFFSGNLQQGIEIAAILGYDGVEISVCDPDALDARAIKSMISDNGLEIVTLGTGQSFVDEGLFLVTDDERLLIRTLERIKKIICFAAEVGSKYITLGGIRGKTVYSEHDEMLRRLADSTRQLAEFALDYSICLLIEPVNRYEVSTIFRLEQAYSHMNDIKSDNVSLLYDVFHANIEEKSILEPIEKYVKNIGVIHFADSNRLPPFGGHIPFYEIARCLKTLSYTSYVSIESMPIPEDYVAAKNAIGALNTIFER